MKIIRRNRETRHRPGREGARQDEAENGEGGDWKRRSRRREQEAARGRRGKTIAAAEEEENRNCKMGKKP